MEDIDDFSSFSSSSSGGSIDLDEAIEQTTVLTINTMLEAAIEEEEEEEGAHQYHVFPVVGVGRYLEENYMYFQQRYDACGKLGFTGIQKCIAALRQLAYGSTVDSFDENFEMSERVLRESLANFCEGVRSIYGSTFLRRPTSSDVQRLYDAHEQLHGFPGMIGSIDCMHWAWEMCPTAWRGTHTRGDIGQPSMILQVVASTDLWIWNAYFGQQVSNKDINVFESSHILE
uniref:uncharacterized protein LOC122583356 n=1 Tax=Erigeron canadensis TaxID=72917 RepID=UPI001CB899DD|nr:uncharacterized protein LOC122583356 [Erigeron canadensis]